MPKIKLKKVLNNKEEVGAETGKKKPKVSKDRDFKEDIDYMAKNFTNAYDHTDETLHVIIKTDEINEFWIINEGIWECIITHDGNQYSYLTGGDFETLDEYKKHFNLPL